MNEIEKPQITVLMSVYNGQEFLAEAIESVLGQTFSNFEFIIINDGSTDQTLGIINKYACIDNRIVLVSRENKGLIASLNEGIELANAKYIARMDADDICLPERFQIQFDFMEANPEIGVCGSWAKVFGEGMNKILRHPATMNQLKPKLLFSVCFAHPTVIIRREILLDNNLRYSAKAEGCEDYELWTRLINHTQFSNVQQVLLKYRYVATSISRTADSEKSNKRYVQLKSIFSIQLDKLDLVNSEAENLLHFIILSNERIAEKEIKLFELDKYCHKIIQANRYKNIYEESELLKILSKKFLVSLYYQSLINKWNMVKVLGLSFLYTAIKCTVMSYIRSK
ncbi:glycosyltransferase family 2 protein [Aliivibrio sifiae]|uniref:glycosyltransferase family 2 protein n=1 Tax=Aliivibrio sifiae TaxID=566293 RepID=UPI003D0F2AB6